jgi:hypothetical protein
VAAEATVVVAVKVAVEDRGLKIVTTTTTQMRDLLEIQAFHLDLLAAVAAVVVAAAVVKKYLLRVVAAVVVDLLHVILVSKNAAIV